jgi:hypothetical protein
MRRPRRPAALLLLVAALSATAAPAAAQDRADYYYPPVGSSETFDRVLAPPPPAARGDRLGFLTHLTDLQARLPYAPRFAIFAKGADADEAIAVALDDAVFATLFRARAVMAQLSNPSRDTAFFRDEGLSDQATFYDLLKALGFRHLTITDGRSWSHRVEFR